MVREPGRAAETVTDGLFGPCRPALTACALFSAFVNLLMLTGPLFMLQVYDRVLPARSSETLAALFLLVVFCFGLMAVADVARTRILARCADHVRQMLDGRVFPALLALPADSPGGAAPLRDIDALGRAIAAPVTLAAMDLPWLPLFLGALCLLHPLLGLVAGAGGAALLLITWAAHGRVRALTRAAAAAALAADHAASQFVLRPDEVAAFALQAPAAGRWQECRRLAGLAEARLADTAGLATAATRAARLLLQSAMLALAAWLCLRGEVSAGAMSAASILTGRALSPLEALIGGWPLAERGLSAWRRLSALEGPVPPPAAASTSSIPPRLSVQGLAVRAPGGGGLCLSGLSLSVGPGEVLGVIGPSGSGKTMLMRTLAGLCSPAAGEVRLGSAGLHRLAPAERAAAIGYLPQAAALFDGTIADNIARLRPPPDPAAVVAAARAAGAHEMISGLADGYTTRLHPGHTPLSGGQIQRICLARALFGSPPLLLLDEPDTALDAEGALALSRLLRRHRAAGGATILTAHRQALVRDCDLLLALGDGGVRAFGPRDQVLDALGFARLSAARPPIAPQAAA
ncbi:MAG: ATP-binding cassette domain-containing protein [Proteobacteria bacterium]|nr:ATP-binding cassette domain-containing protein [Pseudomonadota bacterium]MBS0571788.1 ATP-binding cassette domain-containing protein [Pseudomonadota bacterium]